MKITKKTIIQDLVNYSTINFDKENILQESDYLGCTYQELAQDVSDAMAFEWNRMTRDDPKFNEFQERIRSINIWIRE